MILDAVLGLAVFAAGVSAGAAFVGVSIALRRRAKKPVIHMRDDRPGWFNNDCDAERCTNRACYIDDQMRYSCDEHVSEDAKALERATFGDLPEYEGHTPEGVTCVIHGVACPKPWAMGTFGSVSEPGTPFKAYLEDARKRKEAERLEKEAARDAAREARAKKRTK